MLTYSETLILFICDHFKQLTDELFMSDGEAAL